MKKPIALLMSLVCFAVLLSASVSAFDGEASQREFESCLKSYPSFAYLTNDSLPLPGAEQAQVLSDTCSCMTAQGICTTEKYILISAYCNINSHKKALEEYKAFGDNEERLALEENHKKHNSVIYVLSKQSGELLTTLVLSDKNHVGGLAYDGKYIIVAKSTDKQVSLIDISFVDSAVNEGKISLETPYHFTLDCGCTASFVTYFEGTLWVGVFDEKQESEIYGLSIIWQEGQPYAERIKTAAIPKKSNGGGFYRMGDKLCYVADTSYGRKRNSSAYVYEVESYDSERPEMKKRGRYILPPLMEEIAIDGDKAYFIFESSAATFREIDSPLGINTATEIVDKICITDCRQLFSPIAERGLCAFFDRWFQALSLLAGHIFS